MATMKARGKSRTPRPLTDEQFMINMRPLIPEGSEEWLGRLYALAQDGLRWRNMATVANNTKRPYKRKGKVLAVTVDRVKEE